MKLLYGAAIALAGCATASNAATLNGQTFGMFTGTDGDNVDGLGRYAVWPDDPCFEGGRCTGQSFMTFLEESGGDDDYVGPDHDFDFNYVDITPGKYLIGGLKWGNAASAGSITDDNFSLSATLKLDLDEPDLPIATQSISLEITNTLNPAGDIVGGSALQVGNLTYDLALPIDLGDNLYLTGFSIMSDGNPDNSFDPVTGIWQLQEHRKAKLKFYAHVTEIPLPATGWMLIAGLGGLGALRRKR